MRPPPARAAGARHARPRAGRGEVGERLATAGPGPQRRVGRRRGGEAGRVAAVGAVGMGGGRYPPPRGPHLVVADLGLRGQPEDGERVSRHEVSVRGTRNRRRARGGAARSEAPDPGPRVPQDRVGGSDPRPRSRPRRDLRPGPGPPAVWKTGPAGLARTSPRDIAQPTARSGGRPSPDSGIRRAGRPGLDSGYLTFRCWPAAGPGSPAPAAPGPGSPRTAHPQAGRRWTTGPPPQWRPG